ncbi:uncharacterized protein LOC124275294 [Haliotis rubra]|uniref:uncharacterized protein LOC124275294 n=1 Tax=Haliotis rubra TaxID=36100 RepID=UPI001EE6095F|nr:uncharacterized protein LOC124275294 [Haliotis rubra]
MESSVPPYSSVQHNRPSYLDPPPSYDEAVYGFTATPTSPITPSAISPAREAVHRSTGDARRMHNTPSTAIEDAARVPMTLELTSQQIRNSPHFSDRQEGVLMIYPDDIEQARNNNRRRHHPGPGQPPSRAMTRLLIVGALLTVVMVLAGFCCQHRFRALLTTNRLDDTEWRTTTRP